VDLTILVTAVAIVDLTILVTAVAIVDLTILATVDLTILRVNPILRFHFQTKVCSLQ